MIAARHNQAAQRLTAAVYAITRWSVIGMVGFIASIYLASAVVWIVKNLGIEWSVELPVGAMIYRVVTYLILTLIIGGAVYYRNRDRLVSMVGMTRMLSWKDIGLTVAGVVIYALGATLALYVASKIPGFPLTQSQDLGVSQVYGVERFIAFIVFVILTPVFEEVIFRGLLYGKLRAYAMPWWVPAIIVSALFGLAHMQWNVAIDVFCLSVVACALREVTGSIWAGIVLHVVKNLVAFMVTFVFVQNLVR